MFAMNLVDVIDVNTNYGILFCGNDKIDEKLIQKKVCEIKGQIEKECDEWGVEDIIARLPADWKIFLQNRCKRIII